MRDERRREFSEIDTLRRRPDLAIGVPLDSTQLAVSLRRYFNPDVKLVSFESPGAFFASGRTDVDAFLMPAESAAAFTLLHPEMSVVVPQPNPVKLPYAFGVGLREQDLVDAINEWIVFADRESAVSRANDYWIIGRGAQNTAPRWSILRDVLGWRRP